MIEFKVKDKKKYKIKDIWNNAVYTKEFKANHLSGFYYLIFWKNYIKDKNIWEPILVVQYFGELIGTFYKDNFNKLIATSLSI